MTHIPTVAYVHSKICEAILFQGVKSSFINLDGVIYGRNYDGGLHYNSLTLLEDQIADDLTLLSYAVMFKKFLDRIKFDEIRLILPHFYNPLFKLFSSHAKVKQVYFMEEGDLSYGVNHFPNDAWRSKVEKKLNNNILQIIKSLGYLIEADEFYFHGSENWYGDPWGKYSGSIVSSPDALGNFPGERINIQLEIKKIFDSPVGLLLIPNPSYFIEKAKKLLMENSIAINEEKLKLFVLNAICECIADQYGHLLSFAELWYYKLHPSVSPDEGQFFDQYLSKFFEQWAGSEAEFHSKGMELSFINFEMICSIGSTSAERYAKAAHGIDYSFHVIDNEIILKNTFEKIFLNWQGG